MSKYQGGERYKYPDSDVLINNADARDQASLDAFEADATAVRLLELIENPLLGSFDLAHLQAIHQHIFQDVYLWAGEFRQADIQKGSSYFGNWSHMPAYLNKKLMGIQQENWLAELSPELFVCRLAYYMSEINAAHPFLEGNGRVQRAFCSQLAEQAGYFVDFEDVDQDQMYSAMIASFNGNEAPLEKLLSRIVAIIE